MKRIAITGLSRAGKSAFLTALLWNIEYEMEYKDRACRSLSVLKKYKEMTYVTLSGTELLDYFQTRAPLSPFPLDDKMEEFRLGRFPSKTTSCESICFRLQASMPKILSPLRTLRSHRYHFVDFPGERLEDALIHKHDHYESWSEQMHELLSGEKYPRCRELSEHYRVLLRDTDTPPADVIAAYKELLYSFAVEALPISPSSFMLSPQGVRTKKSNYQSAICGLSAEEEFVPLTENWRDTDSYKQMELHYKQYKNSLISPVFNLVNTADVLVVLMDITDILKGGYQRYRASLEWLSTLPSLCESSFLANPFDLGFGIKKVAFVATQSDRVLREDIPHLENLLIQITQKVKKEMVTCGIAHDNIKRFYCSACISTNPVAEGKLAAYFGDQKKAYSPERIPRDWPGGLWDSQAPIPYPSPPPIAGYIPPPSSNLDEILTFIMD